MGFIGADGHFALSAPMRLFHSSNGECILIVHPLFEVLFRVYINATIRVPSGAEPAARVVGWNVTLVRLVT